MAGCKNANRVLVGTYRPEKEAWIRGRRLYNLPLPLTAFIIMIDGKRLKDISDLPLDLAC